MSTRSLRQLGNVISVPISLDAAGYLGRECPNEDCLGYFKVIPGTGLPGTHPCICPYCGTKEDHDHFWTRDQLKYAESSAFRDVVAAFDKELKGLEFDIKPASNALLGIGMSLKVQPGRPVPLHRYSEKRLETEVVCDRCTLRYAIYGVFGYCPDCGVHNNLGILEANLALVEKMLQLAAGLDDPGLAAKLVENALEDCVSAFDGWGRGTVAAFAAKAADPDAAARVSFQNVTKAQAKVLRLFSFDLAAAGGTAEFAAVNKLLQKRHLVAHRMGVVDQEYIDSTGDRSTVVGRKVGISSAEIHACLGALRTLATAFVAHLEAIP